MTDTSAYRTAETLSARMELVNEALASRGFVLDKASLHRLMAQQELTPICDNIPPNLNRTQEQRLQQTLIRHAQTDGIAEEPFVAIRGLPAHYGTSDLAPLLLSPAQKDSHPFTKIYMDHHPIGTSIYWLNRIRCNVANDDGRISICYIPGSVDDKHLNFMHTNSDRLTLFEIAIARSQNGACRPAILPRFGDAVITESTKTLSWRITDQPDTLTIRKPVIDTEYSTAVRTAFLYGVKLLVQSLGINPETLLLHLAYPDCLQENEAVNFEPAVATTAGILNRTLDDLLQETQDVPRTLWKRETTPVYIPALNASPRMEILGMPQRYQRAKLNWDSKYRVLQVRLNRDQKAQLQRKAGQPINPQPPATAVIIDHDRCHNRSLAHFGKKIPKYVRESVLASHTPRSLHFERPAATPVHDHLPPLVRPGANPPQPSIQEASATETLTGMAYLPAPWRST